MWKALPFKFTMITVFISATQLVDGCCQVFPVALELCELRPALGGELVVLARRSGVRLLPLVVNQFFTPHFAEQRVQRAFLSGEVCCRQKPHHVCDIYLVGGDDFQDQELQESLADRDEFLFGFHEIKATLLYKGTCNKNSCQR